MSLVWSLWIVSLLNTSFLLQVLMVSILSVLSKSKWLILLFALMTISALNWNPPEVIEAKVVSISDYSFVVRKNVNTYRIKMTYEGALDDVVRLEDFEINHDLNVKDSSMRVKGVIDDAKITILKKGETIRSNLWKKLEESPFRRAIIFNEYLEDYPLLSSLSMQLGGLLTLIRYCLRFSFNKNNLKLIEVFTIALYGLIFGFTFGVIRIILGRLKVNRDKQMLVLLILYPGVGIYLGFIYPFCLDLLHSFSSRFKGINSQYVYPILMSILNYRVNILELLFFKVQRVFCGLLLVMAFIPKLDFISIGMLELFQKFLNVNHRLIILGKYPLFIILCVLITYYFKKLKLAYTIWLIGFILCVFPLGWRIHFIDVGQGDATLIQAPFNAYSILIDTGHPRAESKITKALNRYSVKLIDDLIITHDDLDHQGNVEMLKERSRRIVDSKNESVPFITSYLSDIDYGDDNENSLILSLETKRTSFLFMGDAGIRQERDLITRHPHLSFDVLKLGHHGSRTSTSEVFLASIKARYGIISTYGKMYGHPHIEVMRNLYRFQVRPLLTENSGDITFGSLFLFDYLRTDALGFGIIR